MSGPPDLELPWVGSPVAHNQYVVGRGFHLKGQPLYCDDPGTIIRGGPGTITIAGPHGSTTTLPTSGYTFGRRCQQQATHAWKVRSRHDNHEFVIARCSGKDKPAHVKTHADTIKDTLRDPGRGYDLVEAILPIEGPDQPHEHVHAALDLDQEDPMIVLLIYLAGIPITGGLLYHHDRPQGRDRVATLVCALAWPIVAVLLMVEAASDPGALR